MHPQAFAHHQAGLRYHQDGDLLPAVREYLRALALDPTMELTRQNLAALYLRLGETEKAIAQYSQLLELNPLSTKAYFNLGTLYSSQHQWQEAAEQFERLLTLESEHLPALTNLGWIYRRQGEMEKALEIIEKANKLDPGNPKIQVQLGHLFADNNQREKALALFKEAQEKDPEYTPALVALADYAWSEGIPGEALRWAQEALKHDPTEQRARELCLWCLRMFADEAKEAERDEEHAAHLESILALEPGQIEPLEELRTLYQRLGELAKLCRVLELLNRRQPDPATALLLGECLLKCGKRDEAKNTFRALLQQGPNLAATTRLFALAKEDQDPLEAVALARQIANLDPGHLEAHLLLAEEAARGNRHEETVQRAGSVLALNAKHVRAQELFLIGVRALAKGTLDPVKAAGYWGDLLKRKPDDIEALVQLGRLCFDSGRYPEAAKHYKQLLALNPRDTETAFTLAIIYRRMGIQEGAIAILNAILERHPHVGSKVTLAELEPEKAREHLAKALEWNPRSSEALVALGNIEFSEGHIQKAWAMVQEALEIARTEEAIALGKACLRSLTSDSLRGDLDLSLQLALRLLELDPIDSASLRLMGRICRRKGISAKAAEAFSGILALDPGDPGALHGVYRAYRHMNLPTQARQILHQSLKIKKRLRIFRLLIDSFKGEKNLYGALEHAEELYAWRPEHPLAKSLLAECCRHMAQHALDKKDYPIASYYWERLRTIYPEDCEATRQLAALYLKAKDYRHALPVVKELHEAEPDNRPILVNLAWLYQQTQQPKQAIPCFEKALAQEDDLKLRLVLAQLYRQVGDLLNAQGTYLEIIQETPEHIPSHQALAEISWEQGSYVECHFHARELLRLRPNDARGRELAINCLQAMVGTAKTPRDRISLYEELLELLPQDTGVLEKLAEAYQEEGDNQRATPCYERLVQLTPRNRRSLFLLGECLAKAGNLERAKEVLSALDRAEPHLGAIETLAMRLPGEDAIPYLQRLLHFVPRHFEALLKLGKALPAHEAVPVLEKALGLSPGSQEAKAALVAALEPLAMHSIGLMEHEYWRRVLDLQPVHPQALFRLSRLVLDRDLNEAAEYLVRLVETGKADGESKLILAKYWLAKGQRADALELLTPISQENGEAALLLASLAQEDDDFSQAERCYLQALTLNPRDSGIQTMLGKLYHARGRYREALAYLEPLGGEESQELVLDSLHQLAKEGDDEAVLKELLIREPDNQEARTRLGTLLYEGERLEEALPLLDRVNQGLQLGDALHRLGRLEEAQAVYEEMLEHDGRRQDLKLLLCEVAIDQGDDTPPKLPKVMSAREKEIAIRCFRKLARKVPKPRRYWHRILDLAPDDTEALRALSKIYLASEDFGAAKSLLEQLNQLSGTPEVRYDLAIAHLGLHEREIAKRVLTPSRHDLKSLLLLAKLHLEDEEPETEALYRRVLVLVPDNLEAHKALGQMAFERKDYAGALSHLEGVAGTELTQAECHRMLALTEDAENHWRALLSLAPKDREGRRQLGQLLYEHEEFEEALKILEPSKQGLLILDCYRKLGRLDDAMQECEGLLAAAPGDKELAIALSEAADSLGLSQKALEIVERVIALDRNHPQARRLALRYLDNLVKQAKTQGDTQSATRALEKLKILIPEREILRHLGQAYQALGLTEKALGIFEGLLKQDPNDRDLALLVGEACLKIGNRRRAKPLFKQIIQENPHHLPAHMALAEIFSREGAEAEALEHLERVLARKPGHKEATDLAIVCLRELAHQAYEKKKPEQATSFWEQLNKLDPEDTEALYELGRLYYEGNKFDRAAQKLKRILEKEFDADTAYRLATCLNALGDENEARIWLEQVSMSHLEAALALVEMAQSPEERIMRLQEVLMIAPEHPESRMRLARLLLETQEPEQALKYLDDPASPLVPECHRMIAHRGDPEAWAQVLEHLPDDLEALQATAMGNLKAGEQFKAAEVLDRISQLREDPVLYQEQGDLWMRLGELERATAAYEQALVLSPNHLPSKYGLAKIHWETDHLAEAWKRLEEILQKRPNYPEAQALAYRCLDKLTQEAITVKDPESAAYFTQKQLEIRPGQIDLLRRLAHCQLDAAEYAPALESFQILMEQDPADFDAFLGIARCQHALGHHEEARQELQRLLVLAPEHLEGIALAAQVATKLKRNEEAIELYHQALEIAPNHPEYSVALAELLIKGNDTHQALELLTEVMERHPENEFAQRAYFNCLQALAKEAHENGVPELAINFTRKILERVPDDTEALQHLSQLLIERDDPDEALETYQKAIELHPDNPELVAQMADLLGRLDRKDEAIRLLSDNLEQFPRHSDSYATLAQLVMEEPTKAREYAKQALEYKPKHRQAKRILIEANRKLAQERGDAELWQEILQLDAKDPEALLMMGHHLFEIHPEEALEYLARLLKAQPTHPDGLYLQARCHLALDQDAKAEKCAQKLLKQDKDSVRGHLILGLLAQSRGESEKVAEHLEIARSGERDASTLVALGEVSLHEGATHEALAYAQQALEEAPSVAAKELAVNCHLALAEEDPQHHYEAILGLVPTHFEALAGLARVMYESGDPRCEGICREALAQKQAPGVTTLLAEVLMREGRTEEGIALLEEVTASTPFIPALQTLGEHLWQQGESEGAHQAFERILEEDPFHVAAHLALGEIAFQKGEVANAWLEVERVLEFDPEHTTAKLLAVQIAQHFADDAQQRQDYPSAIGYLKRIIELDPQAIDTRLSLADAYQRSGQDAQAVELCQELMSLGMEEPDLLSLWGRALEGLERTEEAAIAYERVLEQAPQHLATMYHLAQLSWKTQRLDRAWELVDNLVALAPQHAEGRTLQITIAKELGGLAFRRGEYTDALTWWQFCYQSADMGLLRQMAQAYAAIGDLNTANRLYRQLLEQDPDDLETSRLVAELYLREGDVHRAEKHLRILLEKNPRNPEIRLSMARISQHTNRPKEALDQAYQVMDFEPQNPEALAIQGWAHKELLEYRSAIEAFEELSALNPQDPEPQHELAMLYRDSGQLEMARKAVSNAIYHSPKNPLYFNTLGTVYTQLGHWDEAEASFSYALQLAPDYGEAYANLGFALVRAGHKAKARPYLEQAGHLLTDNSEMALSVRCALDLY